MDSLSRTCMSFPRRITTRRVDIYGDISARLHAEKWRVLSATVDSYTTTQISPRAYLSCFKRWFVGRGFKLKPSSYSPPHDVLLIDDRNDVQSNMPRVPTQRNIHGSGSRKCPRINNLDEQTMVESVRPTDASASNEGKTKISL